MRNSISETTLIQAQVIQICIFYQNILLDE